MSDSLGIVLAVVALMVLGGAATIDQVSPRRCPACGRSTRLIRANRLLCARCHHPAFSHLFSEVGHSSSVIPRAIRAAEKLVGSGTRRSKIRERLRSFSGSDQRDDDIE